MTTFAERVTEDRRLSELLVLEASPGYAANVYLVTNAIEGFGHQASHDVVAGDLDWLAEQGLITKDAPGGVTIAKLTTRGADVALGRARCTGVKRPTPR